MLSQRSLGASGIKVLPSDDEFNSVSFLSHFDGTNNGVNNVFDDGSTSNHTMTANGTVTQGSFGPFAREEGAWGWSFDSSAVGLELDYGSTSHNYWNSNFTWEFWVNTTDADTFNTVFGCWSDNSMNGGSYQVAFPANGKIDVAHRQSSTGNGGAFLVSATAINDGAWHHIAITQVDDGSTKYFRIFVDGVLDAYDTETPWTQGASGQKIAIGGLNSPITTYEPARRFTGHLSNWRIVESIVYSTASTTIGATIFTPPTGPLTAISNTRILSCQSNRFVDNSANAYAITGHGNGKTTTFGPFLTDEVYDPAVNAASLFVKAQGDYLSFSTAGTPLQTPSTFTAEGWFYLTQAPASGVATGIISCGNAGDSNGSNSWMLGVQDDLKPRIVSSGYVALTAAGTPVNLNEWCHVAMTYDGSTWSLYQNGVRSNRSTTQLISGTNHNQGYIGRDYYDTSRFAANAYYSDVRMVTSLLYTDATYTVPTAPLTAITNTQLLLDMADGQAIDSAAQTNLTLYGNAKLSTTQAKFGDTSLALDGSGDYAIAANNRSFNFGTGDFTIEFWYYGDSTQNDYLFDTRLANDNEARASVYFNSNNKLSYYTSNTTRITSTIALTDNTWTHIALVRSSAVTRFYFDGTQDNQSFSDTLNMPSAQLVIGSKWNGTAFVTGYFDDFRISNMARYTSNFTAPSAPFPDKGD